MAKKERNASCLISLTAHRVRRFRYSYSSVAKVGIGHYNDDSRNLSLSRRLWQITMACSYDGSGSITNWSAGVFDEGGGYRAIASYPRSTFSR